MNQALLVIDVQKIYTDSHGSLYVTDSEVIVNRINSIIEKYVQNDKLIIYCFHKYRNNAYGRMFDYLGVSSEPCFLDGSAETEPSEQLLKNNESCVIEKTQYDCFENTDLLKILNDNGIDKIQICGFMTEYCCESTARSAHGKGFFVDFIIDATGTPFLNCDEVRTISKVIQGGFAKVVDTDFVLLEV